MFKLGPTNSDSPSKTIFQNVAFLTNQWTDQSQVSYILPRQGYQRLPNSVQNVISRYVIFLLTVIETHGWALPEATRANTTSDGGWGFTEDINTSNNNPNTNPTDEVERRDAEATKNGVVENLWEALNEVDVKLADKQADVNSPLYSAKTFEELGL